MKAITIDTTKNKLDARLITDFIANSYWGKGRTIEQTENSIENSINFGVYMNNEQIGYARVITDYTIFAYLSDVFIIEKERGKGYSKRLLNYIVNHPQLKHVEKWKLDTADAHGLYQKFGFKEIENPKRMMERKTKDNIND
ncbi:GNAT family N-acetyltransferase [Maribacter sp. PR1]|uniref:GNAT family N-acetyltransferase n=1 Tax=Maribacter cobaltidurans TaxID=1178778 RepID=A0ABU7IYW5_9FLAO|nr:MULTISPECIES: GNAT family N-acetyltransferase [Maribacter]MDC6390636.1 GNAT family N-acetyltransferase [Maribacter sp. PR1]MEE1978028.1 GNAT family N-acetyltransferase [Maribacter cobaltidurans]